MRPRFLYFKIAFYLYWKDDLMIYTFFSIDVRRGSDPALTQPQLNGPWGRKVTNGKFRPFEYLICNFIKNILRYEIYLMRGAEGEAHQEKIDI